MLNEPTLLKQRLASLAARPRLVVERPDLHRAAVLVPFVFRSGEPHVILTVRTMSVATHKGQISFPGGHVESGDRTLVDTALREAREEIGLDPSQVEVLGLLDDMATSTQFLITPVAGLVDSAAQLFPDPAEVAQIVEVPLAAFLNPTIHEIVTLEHNGACHRFHRYIHAQYVIWGATAGILHDLLAALLKEQESTECARP